MQRQLLSEIPHSTWSRRQIEAVYTPEYVERLLAKAQDNLRSMDELARLGLDALGLDRAHCQRS